MAEARKPVARIQLPVKKAPEISVRSTPGEGNRLSQGGETRSAEPSVHGDGIESDSARGVHLLMSQSRPPPKRDPLVLPMVGLLLAFSVIALIVQLLIAFS
jgi:hypothetical protein